MDHTERHVAVLWKLTIIFKLCSLTSFTDFDCIDSIVIGLLIFTEKAFLLFVQLILLDGVIKICIYCCS